MSESLIDNRAYMSWLQGVKETIRGSQIKAALGVNQQLLALYWHLGEMIDERQENARWRSGFLAQLAGDLKSEFPDIKGFSRSNLSYIRKWYRFYRGASEKIPQLVGQIPWGHNRLILDKISDLEEAAFYAQKTIEHGWSRAVLSLQLESRLYHREEKAITNFDKTLPASQSELAQQALKDPYVFDFLSLGKEAKERDIEKALLEQRRSAVVVTEGDEGSELAFCSEVLAVDGEAFGQEVAVGGEPLVDGVGERVGVDLIDDVVEGVVAGELE